MLTAEQNEQLTRVGAGTAMGALMRRYWQPVGLSSEIPPGSPPVPVRVLGEDLVLFRAEDGQVGLLGLHCSHRGADLSYGRIEDGGLRCLYHGWLYDVHGRCLEQPAEPPRSRLKDRICHLSYPCLERAGLVFAYLGGDDPPLLPAYEFLSVPPDQIGVHKVIVRCNYLQKKEGNLDPAHLSFLHRFFEGAEDLGQSDDGLTENEAALRAVMRQDAQPGIQLERTDFGLRIYAIRHADSARDFVKITNFVFPNISTHGIGIADGYNVLWHVPIDDTHTWEYDLVFCRERPDDPDAKQRWEQLREAWAAPAWLGPDFRTTRNLENRYLQDRDEMREKTYAGMGPVHFVHDAFATEGMGPIADRTREVLGSSDRPIIALRRALLDALGGDVALAPHVVRDESENEFPEIRSVEAFVPKELAWPQYAAFLLGRGASPEDFDVHA